MNWRRGLNLWHILLLLANCLLIAAIIHVWWGEEGTTVPSRSANALQVPKAPLLRDQQPLNAFKVVATKNLFVQDRTAPESGAPAKVTDSLEGRHLLGTIIIGDERAALISSKPQGRGQQAAEVEVVRLGEEWDGLKVLEISNEAVVFQGKDGKKTLNFPE